MVAGHVTAYQTPVSYLPKPLNAFKPGKTCTYVFHYYYRVWATFDGASNDAVRERPSATCTLPPPSKTFNIITATLKHQNSHSKCIRRCRQLFTAQPTVWSPSRHMQCVTPPPPRITFNIITAMLRRHNITDRLVHIVVLYR
jgi:hypothetical protein